MALADDYKAELKRLAEAAARKTYETASSPIPEVSEFLVFADPPAILALLEENERLRRALSRVKRIEDGDSMARWPDDLYAEATALVGRD